MIIGHLGVAYAARRYWPRIPLAALLLATFAADLLREVLLAGDMDYVDANLYSHASPWCLFLATGCGLLALAGLRSRPAVTVIVVVVLSHIALDAISGHKFLWYWGPQGLDLQARWYWEFILEVALLWAGWRTLRTAPATAPRWAARSLALGALVLAQLLTAMGEISQRPYYRRCLAYPEERCTDDSLLTHRWLVSPFW